MAPKKKGRKTAAAPAAAPAVAYGPEDANELDKLPDDKAYESLGEDDAPPRDVLEEEDLLGLPEDAHEEKPAEQPAQPPTAAAAAPAPQVASYHVTLPAEVTVGQQFQSRTPDGQVVQLQVPPGAQGGQTLQVNYTPQPTPIAAPAAQGTAAMAKKAATGATAATKKLTEAQQRAKASDAKWTAIDIGELESGALAFGRPEFKPYKPGTAPDGFVADATYEKGGSRPGLGRPPNTHPAVYVAGQGFDKTTFEQLESATNGYAAALGAGSKKYWAEYKPFDTEEIMAGCGLILRAGVAPTPEMELLFRDPDSSFVFGDSRAKKVFPGTGCGGSARRFVQFRSFLHIQSHSPFDWKGANVNEKAGEVELTKLDWKTAGPLKKCEPLLSYCRLKWEHRWLPGMNLSLDEMTLGFKGRSALATRIKYKREGDGFQCDCLCEDGYCYTFWFRCDNPPRTVPKDVSDRDNRQAPQAPNSHLQAFTLFTAFTFILTSDQNRAIADCQTSTGTAALRHPHVWYMHAHRCAWLLERLPGMWYRVWMDNLFTSWKFGEMCAQRSVLFAGTCQLADWRGMHSAVCRSADTLKSAESKAASKGTLKVSWRPHELKDAEGQPIVNTEVICCSYHDEHADKAFHMMANTVEAVSVITIWRQCFSSSTRTYFWLPIKRLSLADLYNHNMNSVDLADQLRGVYRPDGLWMRMRKWWWAFFLWLMGQSVINAYVEYKKDCVRHNATAMSHLDFHVAVATAWCTTPKMILAPEKAAAAMPSVTPEARKGRARSGGSASGTGSDVPTKPKPLPQYRDNAIDECKESYRSHPELHTVEAPLKSEAESSKGKPKNCNVCGTGEGPWTVKLRRQKVSIMRCAKCRYHVCSPECWQVLHGCYTGAWGLEPMPKQKGRVCVEIDDEDASEEDAGKEDAGEEGNSVEGDGEGDGEDDGDENGDGESEEDDANDEDDDDEDEFNFRISGKRTYPRVTLKMRAQP